MNRNMRADTAGVQPLLQRNSEGRGAGVSTRSSTLGSGVSHLDLVPAATAAALCHSVQFSHSVMSDSLRPHGLQHTRFPWPSPTLGTCSSSCPSGWWCHPTMSSSVVPFSSCLQPFLASGSFPMSQFFTSGGQSVGVSALASVLPMNIQDWFPLGWTGWIPLQSKGLFKSLLQHHSSKASILRCSAFFIVQLSHPYINTAKTIALTRQTYVGKSLLFIMLSRFRSKGLLISWLQPPLAVILEHKKIKSATVSTVSPSISHEVMGPDAMKVLIIYLRSQTSKVNSSKCYWFCKKQESSRKTSISALLTMSIVILASN